VWLLLLGVLATASACSTGRTPGRSPWFAAIQTDTTGILRGLSLGEPFSSASERESATLLLHDAMGSLYRQRMAGRQFIDIEYWRQPSDTNHIAAVCLNIHLNDEMLARQLFKELTLYYTQLSGRNPEGSFGQYVWWFANDTRKLELKFENLKRDLTLSLVQAFK
jgi:hypothetical protein